MGTLCVPYVQEIKFKSSLVYLVSVLDIMVTTLQYGMCSKAISQSLLPKIGVRCRWRSHHL